MLDETAMNALLLCATCDHGAPQHDTHGCRSLRCTCRATRQSIVDDAVENARLELHEQSQRLQKAG
jgi:hypothetical protein